MCSLALECVGANSTKDEMPADTFNFTQPASLSKTVAFEFARILSNLSFALISHYSVKNHYVVL